MIFARLWCQGRCWPAVRGLFVLPSVLPSLHFTITTLLLLFLSPAYCYSFTDSYNCYSHLIPPCNAFSVFHFLPNSLSHNPTVFSSSVLATLPPASTLDLSHCYSYTDTNLQLPATPSVSFASHYCRCLGPLPY